ncbi:hypothetical protein [Chryseobacterium profundimaris]|uniref:Uncharacterized protein n=1 Tax=Chryseobacterium profundimaris TaxID=1387275 RepID=A0ABY1P0F6_9FLAO|nr:hypothetical protein [Chryseobacterium profundimaris]SMP22624.1 hypothetical protein SAMN06264346_106226 [Chryseobacterium profundimaris]
MGIMRQKLLLQFLLLTFSLINSQIIKIEKKDTFKLIKKEEFKEDGLMFYKDEYNLVIYNKDNIKYNKQNGYKPQILAGGLEICDKCKKEVYYFSIKKIKDKPQKPLNFYPIRELFKKLKNYSLGGGYFFINNTYYKNLGMPIE